MDPTGDRTSTGPRHPDMAEVLMRLDLLEQGFDDLDARVGGLEARLQRAGMAQPRPPITPVHTQPVMPPPPPMAAPRAAWVATAAAAPAQAPAPPPITPATPVVQAAATPPIEPAWEIPRVPSAPEPVRVPRPTDVGSGFTLPELSPGRLLAWVGGAAIVLGAVFFLSLAFSRGWITEPMRVLMGLVAGAGLLGGSVVVFDRKQPILGQVLAAVGIAILELSCFAARSFGLVGPEPVLLATALIAAVATAIAIRFDAQPVGALGFLAVLAAPPIMGAPATLMTVAFLGVVLIASSGVAVARGWRWLPWLAFVVTVPQLLSWVADRDAPAAVAGGAVIAYWLVLGLAALGELWRRPVPVLRDPTAALALVLDVTALGLLAVALPALDALGAALIVVAVLQLAAGALLLTRRSPQDGHGQLLVAAAAPLLGLGLVLWLPFILVPLALALLAVGLGRLAARFGHRVAFAEALAAAGVAGAVILVEMLPATALTGIGFPPLGGARYDLAGTTFIVGGLLGAIALGARWSTTTSLARGAVLALAVALVAWSLMFEVGGLALLGLWCALAAGTAIVALRAADRDGRDPTGDPLLGSAAAVAICAVAWSLVSFRLPATSVDLLSEGVVERVLASLLPIAGLGAVLVAQRDAMWRGALAAGMVLLGSAGMALLMAGTTFVAGAVTLSGDLGVLVGWAALALVALILDERPRLRLARAGTDAVADPIGHPLALSALVPALAMVAWLAASFLAPGAGGGLPAVPFTDEATLATAIVVLAVLAGARLARTWLVRATLVVTAVTLVAVLLPIEVSLEAAVAGWSVLAAGAFLVGRRFGGRADRIATGVGGTLVAVGLGATLLAIAPIARLFPESYSLVAVSGPPNAATLATLAVAAALAVAAWCRSSDRLMAGWLWVGAMAMVGWAISVGVVDAFASGLPAAIDRVEVIRQAQVALSIVWAAMGLGILLLGLLRDLAPFRQAGLGLLAIATVKVFVYDLATMDIAYRVLSLVGLGVLLLVSAWFYLHARHRGGPQPMGG